VRLAPSAHGIQQRPQRVPERSSGVYNSRRRIRVNGALDDSRALQFAELLGERPLSDSGNSALQFRKPFGAFEELLENNTFPAPAYHTGGGFYRADFLILCHNRPGFILYTTYREDVTYSHVTTLASSSSIFNTTISGIGKCGVKRRAQIAEIRAINTEDDLGDVHATGNDGAMEQ
jgi:hypothetical protein